MPPPSETGQQQRVVSPERPAEPPFEERLRSLVEPKKDKKGKILQKAPIGNDKLLRLVQLALQPRMQTPEGLGNLLKEGDGWYLDKKVPEGEWSVLAGELAGEIERLLREAADREIARGVAGGVERGETQEALAEILRRLPPGEEEERWVDVEWQQDFYTRFMPNMEPGFYSRLSSERRREWDTRWRLARAAFYKNAFSADPGKLAENQELIDLTTEQMEILYNIEGVREGLEWYANAILDETMVFEEWDEETGEPIGGGIKKSLVECTSGREFQMFRRSLQYTLKRGFFHVTAEQEKLLLEKAKEGDKKAEEELRALRIKIKSADAIAWNWIWVSNLVESVDSRYSSLGNRRLRKRHGELAPAICSDDLRSVFHPQERFEDKTSKEQEWGAFGKWGLSQIERIKNKTGKKNSRDFLFEGADSPSRFWKHKPKNGQVLIYVPECYPTTSMRSFWEEYREGEEGPTLLLRLQQGQKIDWRQVSTDPWKTNYLTVLLRKANGLLEYFNPGKPIELGKFGAAKAWADPLLDILKRLHLERNEKLKSWAVYAATGGVADVNRRKPSINLPLLERSTLIRALRDKNVRYFSSKERFQV